METAKSNNPIRELLGGKEYIIPQGFEAVIEDGKVIVRKKESGEEKVKRSLIRLIEAFHDVNFPTPEGFSREDLIAYLNSNKTAHTKERAISFIEFLDKNSYEGKMCVSNPECEDIVNAFVEKDWAKLVAYVNKYLTNERQWSDEDEAFLKVAIAICNRYSHKDIADWLKSLRPQHNLRWRRAKAGENIPESIILPDGEEPRFGKCAVRPSYYIPVSELKELPKE